MSASEPIRDRARACPPKMEGVKQGILIKGYQNNGMALYALSLFLLSSSYLTFSYLNPLFCLRESVSQPLSCSVCLAQSFFTEQTIILASAPASPATLQSHTTIITATPRREASKSFRDGLVS